MGWDAYALRKVEHWNSGATRLDRTLQAVFREANTKLKRYTGNGGSLIHGTIGGTCMPFLLRATSITCFEPKTEEGLLIWPQETVRLASDQADWNYSIDGWFDDYLGVPIEGDEEFYVGLRWQTRLFLQTCSEQGLAIVFTW